MSNTAEVIITDSQVRDVIEAALEEYVALLDGRGEMQGAMGDTGRSEATMRQWARATAVLRMTRKGK